MIEFRTTNSELSINQLPITNHHLPLTNNHLTICSEGGSVMRSNFSKTFWVGIVGIIVFATQTRADEAVEDKKGGSISGTVTFVGSPPAPQKINIDKDVEICGAHEKFTENLLVSKKNKGIQNVVVSITNIEKGKAIAMPEENPQLNQKGCWFSPHIQIVPAGATLEILNPDGIMHNIHTLSVENHSFNKAQPKFKKKMTATFEFAEIIKVKCDAHNWMGGWIVVAEHPYYALTDETGGFGIKDVPPGEYTLEYWHETLGKQTKEVTVKAGAEAVASISLKPKVAKKKAKEKEAK